MSFGNYPPQWLALSEKLLKGRIILVLGSVDTGKTTLITYLANFLVKRGKRVAIVDADVGQSDIGPPTTIGLGLVESPIKKMREAKRLAMYFVGAISPEGHLLPMVVGTKKMVEKGLSFADLVLIDTTGLVQGAKGQALKHHKIELVNPDRIIVLQKERELEPLIAPFEKRIHRLGVAKQIRNKTKEERRKRREEGVFDYFKDSEVLEVHLGNQKTEDRSKMSEVSHQSLVISHQSSVFPLGDADYFKNLLLGLISAEGELLELGVVKEFDLLKKKISLFTPLKEEDRISSIQFSEVHLDLESREMYTG